ncbi:MAG: glycosyltransferase [Methanobacterium sp.]|uniref:glycosyltransferase n=1 Tax=Methanobacterium sp. TaxID=2164 RepID=UPI003D8EB9AB
MEVSVIIPMYNEEDNVFITLNEVKKVLKTCGNYQIIAVDDGSSDRTLELLEEYARENPELVVLEASSEHGDGKSPQNWF